MSPVTTVGQVFEAIQQVKAGASAFCTNFFPVQSKLQGWIDHRELQFELREGVAFFFRRDRDFAHLYFCAADTARLEQEMVALPVLRTERAAADLIGPEASLAGLLKTFANAGFRPYSRLVRLARTAAPVPESSVKDSPVLLAEPSDTQGILALLDASFDRFADQLPMSYEIEAAITNRQILVIKEQGELAAFLFFESQGLTSTIRYWLVAEQFRALRLGSALMRHYFATQSAVRRFILWVTANNENAVQKYQHYGYNPDGLVDHVLANELIHA